MATKIEKLQIEATNLGLTLTGDESEAELKSMIKGVGDSLNQDPQPGDGSTASIPAEEVGGETPQPKTQASAEPMIPLSQVQEMIRAEVAKQNDERGKIQKPKKVMEHFARLWRLDGKWIVDFIDRNIDKATGAKIDPYIKTKIHAFNKWNEQRREFEAWIELKFVDGSTKEISLPRYIEHRFGVYCKINKRDKIDSSYVVGEVEKKKEVGDRLVGTGVMIDQEVTRFNEIFTLETPEGEILTVPDYVIA